MKIGIVLNSLWNVYNFRSGILQTLVASGNEVFVIAPVDIDPETVLEPKVRVLPLPMEQKGINPFKELRLVWRCFRLVRTECPDALLTFTAKPNIYGTAVARLLGVPAVCNITGLGQVFVKQSLITFIVSALYRLTVKSAHTVFFQNPDDLELFGKKRLINTARADLLPGSGVNLNRFQLAPIPKSPARKFLFVGRMLVEKGVLEFANAARILREKGVDAEFLLLGPLEEPATGGISASAIQSWEQAGLLTYLGVSSDVRQHIETSHCVVLPSYYREGTPKALLEAAAMGRPVITADTVGCREAIDDGRTGYLCAAQDPDDLAKKMLDLCELSQEELSQMGSAGRSKMEDQFSEEIVVNKYLNVLRQIEMSKPA